MKCLLVTLLTLLSLWHSALMYLEVAGQNTSLNYIAKMRWSPNGNHLAALERGNERVVFYNSSLQFVSVIDNFPEDYRLRDISWNSDSTQLAIGIEQLNRSGKPIIEIWDVSTGTPTRAFSYQDESAAEGGPLAIDWRPYTQQIV